MKKKILDLKEFILSAPHIVASEGEQKCYTLLSEKLKGISDLRSELRTEQEQKLMNEFRKELLPLTHKSYFCKYVYDKPRGYSGDFKTQEMIWLGLTDNVEHRYLGDSDLGKLISSLTFEMENPKANVARVKFLKEEICSAGKRIASLGCGPCLELWDIQEEKVCNKRFFLLDQDDGALKRAMNKISVSSDNVIYVRDNILRFIIKNKKAKLLGPRDFIYLFGLLDYFPVKSSKAIIEALWSSVAPGGKIVITNAHPENPTRLWMEYVGNWFLNYKNKEDLYDVAENLSKVDNIEYIFDNFNVYQYLKITKKH
ncbi:MAG: class I SAM-dependent methyltransferase [Spirochaetales bacterium]|nr:class I SAM-dependent methyltransferase [Spirochaetales bacterium]